MSRMHPNARRATALIRLTSLCLVLAAAIAVALPPTPASAGSTASSTPIVNSRQPLPGDPNTPDEGRSGSTTLGAASRPTSSAWSIYDWVKGLVHHFPLPSR